MTILDTIINRKREEVEAARKSFPLEQLKDQPFYHRNCRSLSGRLHATGSTGIIAEFKRKSPSKGWFKPEGYDALPVAEAYDREGAAGISVLTDTDFFGGSLNDLQAVSQRVSAAVLRKDFTIDAYQLHEAKAFGADAILLIAAALTPAAVEDLAGEARSIGLEVLLEIHNEEELEHISNAVHLVGVNNRNLKTFEVSVQTSLNLINSIPAAFVPVAESGIRDVQTIVELKNAGFKGFLIGENFMATSNPGEAFTAYVKDLKSKA